MIRSRVTPAGMQALTLRLTWLYEQILALLRSSYLNIPHLTMRNVGREVFKGAYRTTTV